MFLLLTSVFVRLKPDDLSKQPRVGFLKHQHPRRSCTFVALEKMNLKKSHQGMAPLTCIISLELLHYQTETEQQFKK